MAYNTPPSKATGNNVTAAEWNTYLRDNFSAVWPYASAGDIPVATAANTLGKLSIGGARKQLVVNAAGTTIEWIDGVPGMFTAAGDIPYGSAADTGAVLPIGSTGQVMTVAAGLPSWQTLTAVTGIGRRGGSATNWWTAGTTNYTPANYKMQGGSVDMTDISTAGSGNYYNSVAVSLPVNYAYLPLAVASYVTSISGTINPALFTYRCEVNGVNQITIYAYSLTSQSGVIRFHWMTLGEV